MRKNKPVPGANRGNKKRVPKSRNRGIQNSQSTTSTMSPSGGGGGRKTPKSAIANLSPKGLVGDRKPVASKAKSSAIRHPIRSGEKSKIANPKSQIISSPWQLRASDGQGVFTKYFSSYIPRKVEADFYEFLREAIPVIDAAFGRLVSLDGHVIVKGDSDSHVDEIQDWIYNVAVNDIQKGMQAFHQNFSNEAFEQGFAMGEYVTDKKRTDIIGLRVADSKFIKFKRTAAGLDIYQKANDDIDYRLLNPANLMYFSINNENQNPYGTPLMRSCEFVAKILATIQNSLLNVWERFGDPSFSIIYKTSKKDGTDLTARRQTIETEFNTAIKAKREGKSADFVRAIDTNSSIEIKIIGADGQILDLEVPSRHVLEQIIAKTGLPPWMLGMHWSTTERLSNAEAEMLLADVATRQSAKMPLFHNLVKTMLLLRGRKWKKGDWWLEWGQVNLHDTVQQAQAKFLTAQANFYYLQMGVPIDLSDISLDKSLKGKSLFMHKKTEKVCGCKSLNCGSKELSRPIPWSELDRLEFEYENTLKTKWKAFENSIFEVLRLNEFTQIQKSSVKAPPPPEGIPPIDVFTFSEDQRTMIMKLLKDFVGQFDWRDTNSSVRWYYSQSFSLGYLQAAKLLGKAQPILNLAKNTEIFEEMVRNGFDLVKNNATDFIVDKLLLEMEGQVLAGVNPTHVAARLKKLFGDKNDDWERLARTEMSMAAESAKLSEWKAWEVKKVEFAPAPDGCPFCQSLAGDYDISEVPVPALDTHPRCRCSIKPAASEYE